MKSTQWVKCVWVTAMLTAIAPSSVAQASTQPRQDTTRMDRHVQSYQDGIKYYQAGQLELARREFDSFLGAVGEHAGGNFMMGLVQLQLEDLEQAKKYLGLAVRYDGEMAAPRGYLGAIEYFLGNPDGGAAQRAALVEMHTRCNGTCENLAGIEEAIARIDANAAAVSGEAQ